MMLSDILDEPDLPICSPRIFRSDRFDYLASLLGPDLTKNYSMRTLKLACDGIRNTSPRDRQELRDLAKECAHARMTYNIMGRHNAFTNIVREAFDEMTIAQAYSAT